MAPKGPKPPKHEGEMDQLMDVRVELPGQVAVNMDIRLMNPEGKVRRVHEEKARLLQEAGFDPTLYQMMLREEAFDVDHASEPRIMLEDDDMMNYTNALSKSIIFFIKA